MGSFPINVKVLALIPGALFWPIGPSQAEVGDLSKKYSTYPLGIALKKSEVW